MENTFESALFELEDIVKKMELGTLSLDESLAAFERAAHLIRFCNEKLENARQKVRILLTAPDGTVTDRAFSEDET